MKEGPGGFQFTLTSKFLSSKQFLVLPLLLGSKKKKKVLGFVFKRKHLLVFGGRKGRDNECWLKRV